MGQLIVVYFLFFSGYGIMYSIVNKGPRYVDSILKNRFIKSLLHFDLIILLYLIVQFFLGHRFKIEIILQSLIGSFHKYILYKEYLSLLSHLID